MSMMIKPNGWCFNTDRCLQVFETHCIYIYISHDKKHYPKSLQFPRQEFGFGKFQLSISERSYYQILRGHSPSIVAFSH